MKALFAKEDTNLALISRRLTSVLQPLVFPEKRNSWIQMMADCIHDFTVIDQAKNPSEEELIVFRGSLVHLGTFPERPSYLFSVSCFLLPLQISCFLQG